MQPHYNKDTNINDLNDIALNKNTNVQIAAKKKCQKYRILARKKPYQGSPSIFETSTCTS